MKRQSLHCWQYCCVLPDYVEHLRIVCRATNRVLPIFFSWSRFFHHYFVSIKCNIFYVSHNHAFALRLNTRNWAMLITGCTVAQHCYNRHVTLLRENGNYDPIKIETLEHIVIMRGTSVPNLVQICPRGPSGQAGELQLSCFFMFFFTRDAKHRAY